MGLIKYVLQQAGPGTSCARAKLGLPKADSLENTHWAFVAWDLAEAGVLVPGRAVSARIHTYTLAAEGMG